MSATARLMRWAMCLLSVLVLIGTSFPGVEASVLREVWYYDCDGDGDEDCCHVFEFGSGHGIWVPNDENCHLVRTDFTSYTGMCWPCAGHLVDLTLDLPPVSFSVDPEKEITTATVVRFIGSRPMSLEEMLKGVPVRPDDFVWLFGDGTQGSGFEVTHQFSEPGAYAVTLLFLWSDVSESAAQLVMVAEYDGVPEATFTIQSSAGELLMEEDVVFDASASTDPDGKIVEYAWDWSGNGTYDKTTTTPTAIHRFSSGGQYTVRLRVTDDVGATDTTSHSLTIVAESPPSPGFTFAPLPPSILDAIAFTDQSTDKDGEIASWSWSFGDGETSSEQDPVHRYTEKGAYTVRLTVTDDEGLTASTEKTVEVVNLPPEVACVVSPPAEEAKPGTRLTVEPRVGESLCFDASASTDPDGEIVEYAWDWESDGTYDETSSEPLVDHWFDAPGEHTVTLRVTDDDGATATHAETVTIAATPEIVEPQEVWALVIGISDYAEVNDLTYARADAEAFTRWLLDTGVEADYITLLLDEEGQWPELDGISSELATLTKARSGLDWLYRMARPDDLVFVFFAGHGFQGDDDDGDETDGTDEFLVLYDAERDAKEATTLRDDEFGRFLDRVESDHVLVVFDSCHSGGQSRSLSGGTRPLGDNFDIFNDFSLEGKLILAAAREDQEALEHEGLGHGLFTHFLLQGLGGEADLDLDYRITAEELHAYVSAEVERFAWEERGREQTPEMTGRGEVGIVLSRTNRPPEASFSIEPEVPYAYGPTRLTDQSTDDTCIVSWSWEFGDGATSTEQHPTHTYDEAGNYSITLTVTDDEGATSTIEQAITVAPPGEVTTVAGDTIVISLGSANGIRVGDRFEVLRTYELSSGLTIAEHKATIEVIEVVGADRTACRIADTPQPVQSGDVVRCEE